MVVKFYSLASSDGKMDGLGNKINEFGSKCFFEDNLECAGQG